MRFVQLAVGTLALTATGCDFERLPGPAVEDRGRVIFWRVEEASVDFQMCSNLPRFREGFSDPSYLVNTTVAYQVSDDGASATMLACATTDPATCVATQRVFMIDGRVLLAVGEPQPAGPVVGLDCSQFTQTDWALEDRGEAFRLEIRLSYLLTGTSSDCDAVDYTYEALGTNGWGIRDCVVLYTGTGSLIDIR